MQCDTRPGSHPLVSRGGCSPSPHHAVDFFPGPARNRFTCRWACGRGGLDCLDGWSEDNGCGHDDHLGCDSPNDDSVCRCGATPTQPPVTTAPLTPSPTAAPTTVTPSDAPTTAVPSNAPTRRPSTSRPTTIPTSAPTARPSTTPPSTSPTALPTACPSTVPTALPTAPPTGDPTADPTANPTTLSPTRVGQTFSPTYNPTADPTANPTADPTAYPSPHPTGRPTTRSPTREGQTFAPTFNPSAVPTAIPTGSPTAAPTSSVPTVPPSANPTTNPTATPASAQPTGTPTTEAAGSSASEKGDGSSTSTTIVMLLVVFSAFAVCLIVAIAGVLRNRQKERDGVSNPMYDMSTSPGPATPVTFGEFGDESNRASVHNPTYAPVGPAAGQHGDGRALVHNPTYASAEQDAAYDTVNPVIEPPGQIYNQPLAADLPQESGPTVSAGAGVAADSTFSFADYDDLEAML